jgi:hypothetical protein
MLPFIVSPVKQVKFEVKVEAKPRLRLRLR